MNFLDLAWDVMRQRTSNPVVDELESALRETQFGEELGASITQTCSALAYARGAIELAIKRLRMSDARYPHCGCVDLGACPHALPYQRTQEAQPDAELHLLGHQDRMPPAIRDNRMLFDWVRLLAHHVRETERQRIVNESRSDKAVTSSECEDEQTAIVVEVGRASADAARKLAINECIAIVDDVRERYPSKTSLLNEMCKRMRALSQRVETAEPHRSAATESGEKR